VHFQICLFLINCTRDGDDDVADNTASSSSSSYVTEMSRKSAGKFGGKAKGLRAGQ